MEQHNDKNEGFFQKICTSHYLMVLACVIPIIIMLAGGYFFGWKNGNLLTITLLAACFLSHLFMMKGHNHQK